MSQDLNFSLNSETFTIGQIPYGEFADLWIWSNDASESEPFATAAEARQNAIRYVRKRAANAREEVERECEDRRYGTIAEQVHKY